VQRGRYIAFEGPEGCGKSTHARSLARDLDAVLTREPGGTSIGTRLRGIVLDPAVEGMSPRAEALIMAADRAQHVDEVIRPALDAGRHVVSDRSVWSSLAYQGVARGLGLHDVRTVNGWAIDGEWPELVLFLDVDDALLAQRLQARTPDRIEKENGGFHQSVLDTFRSFAQSEERWVRIDATGPRDRTAAAIRAVIRERLGLEAGR
jgi:dTMP kinase